MSELRQNPATKTWVIIAKERAKRPDKYRNKEKKLLDEVPEYSESCPFCPGNEDKLPENGIIYEGKNSDNEWTVRVVPNKFPALIGEGNVERKEIENLFLLMPGIGSHEVIIETPIHNTTIGLLSNDAVIEIIHSYRERFLSLSKDSRFKIVIIFKNHGEGAGTSLEHPHSQLIATPIVPHHIRNRIEEAVKYYDDWGKCVYCSIIEAELKLKERIIRETEHFIAFVPFAASLPFEISIIPKKHAATFGEISDSEISDLSKILIYVLGALYRKLNNPDYNYIIHTAPFSDKGEEYYHWHIEILPRLTKVAGFEMGSGIYINTSIPKECASFLKE
ncbi:MAG: galactose-1-phosphate uridylyltransferase [Candidatus Cloacimonadota bacterium]|nr:MAG: galactose-1-phosphate uridylyltransferase [Candidatus Cloacimonadota bacterium]